MSKKYLPALLTLASIIACVFFWDKVVLEYNFTGQAYAEYSINNYNANNDTIRYILFVSLPLIVFLLSHLYFNASNVISIKKVLFPFSAENKYHELGNVTEVNLKDKILLA